MFGQNEIYPIQNFTPADYKAGIQNIDFAQSRDRSVFVGNNLGVLSYNGNDWDVHPFKSGKKARSLAFDEKTNRLYVGSQGTFGYFDLQWNYVPLEDQTAPSFDEVWDVFLYQSKVYFCTFQGIFVYDGTSISSITYNEGFDRSFMSDGKLYTQSTDGHLFEIRNKEIFPIAPQNIKGRNIVGLIVQKDGYLLFYNSGEVERSNAFGARPEYSKLSSTLKGKFVNHVLQLSDTRIAISTQTAGLYIYNVQNQVIENITTDEGLQSNACLRSFQDYSGNLWIGMQNGISLVSINSPMRFINQKINVQGSGYEVFETENGIYYTTSNGIYFMENGESKAVFLKGTEGPAYSIQQISGNLYAGHHTGLFQLQEGNAKRIANTKGLWQVKQLQFNPKFAIGGTYFGLFLFKINDQLKLEPLGEIEGFNESSRFFEEDQEGRIWVGQYYKGLYQMSLSPNMKRVTVDKIFTKDNSIIDKQIVLSKIDNELYLGTRNGVCKVDPATNEIVKADLFNEIIGNQHVYLLVQDNHKNIHVYTDKQVGFYKQISPNNYRFVPSSLFQLRYFFNNDLLNISVNAKNGVLYNANEGFIYYRPELENNLAINSLPSVKKVLSITEKSTLYALSPFEKLPEEYPELVVSHKAKYLQIEVESFQFNERNNQQFRYYLKGFDDDFGQWTNSPVKEYTNLPKGDYEFIVQTLNFFGEPINSKPFYLQVNEPFYKSWIAKCFYVLLGLFMVFAASRWQRLRFNLREQKADKERREELMAIERKKDQALLKMEEDKIKSELRNTNNLLAASTMNLAVKNEFMETIKEKLELLKGKGKNKETKLALEQIVKDINTTLRLQEDWEQFEHHFDRVHGDFLIRLRDEFIDLSPNEQKLCAFLRLNLNTKDIANIMGVSHRGIEVARYRLRKKLDLNKGQNLSKFILEY